MASESLLVANRLSDSLLAAGITQSQLARLIKEPTANVSRWLRGERKVPALVLPKLARGLNVSIEFILTGSHARAGDEPVGAVVRLPRLLRIVNGNPTFVPQGNRAVTVDRVSLEALVGVVPELEPGRVAYGTDAIDDSMAPFVRTGDVLIIRRYHAAATDARKVGKSTWHGSICLVNLTPHERRATVAFRRVLFSGASELHLVTESSRDPVVTFDLRALGGVERVLYGRAVRLLREL